MNECEQFQIILRLTLHGEEGEPESQFTVKIIFRHLELIINLFISD